MVFVGAQFALAFARGGRRIHIESADLKHGLERQQNSDIVVYKQDPSFHPISSILLIRKLARVLGHPQVLPEAADFCNTGSCGAGAQLERPRPARAHWWA
jgi:hypothetical protein